MLSRKEIDKYFNEYVIIRYNKKTPTDMTEDQKKIWGVIETLSEKELKKFYLEITNLEITKKKTKILTVEKVIETINTKCISEMTDQRAINDVNRMLKDEKLVQLYIEKYKKFDKFYENATDFAKDAKETALAQLVFKSCNRIIVSFILVRMNQQNQTNQMLKKITASVARTFGIVYWDNKAIKIDNPKAEVTKFLKIFYFYHVEKSRKDFLSSVRNKLGSKYNGVATIMYDTLSKIFPSKSMNLTHGNSLKF